MGDITALGYLGLKGSITEWNAMAELIGLEAAPASSDSEARFRVDERTWRLAVEEGDRGVAYIGWEVASSAALGRVRETLTAAGFVVKPDPELAQVRGVLELFSCQDPSGFHLEFFFGPEVSSTAFRSPIGATFVTSREGQSLGLGHVVLLVEDAQASKDFYLGLLGFGMSDAIINGPMGSTFAHTNPRHHSLAFGAVPGVTTRLDHFMLEVDDLDVVGDVLDRATAAGVPVTVTLGKHTNDLMTSFYLRTPSGCDLEFGYGGLLIDEEAWSPTWFRSPSIWGHQRTGAHDPNAPDSPWEKEA